MLRDPGRADYLFNVAAFMLYAIAMQIVVMPTLAGRSQATEFALVILFFAVYSVLSNAAGEELGNAFLIRQQSYLASGTRARGDALVLLLFAVLVSLVLGLSFMIVMGWPSRRLAICAVALVLGVCRAFYLSVLRSKRDFSRIFASQFVYLMACLVLAFGVAENWEPLLIFVVADGAAILSGTPLLLKARKDSVALSPLLKETNLVYMNFAGSALLVNSINYLDRVLVLPLLGPQAMGIYYASSSMSKMVALPIGPLSGVILSRMGAVEDSDGPHRARFALKSMLPVTLVTFAFAAGASVLGVALLYPQFMNELWALLLPIAFATAVGGAVSLARPTLMRFLSSRNLLWISMLYVAVLVTACVALLPLGLVGFAYAIALARLAQGSGFALALAKISGRGADG